MIGPTVAVDLAGEPAAAARPAGAEDLHVLVLHGGIAIGWLRVPATPPLVDRRFVLELLDDHGLAALAAAAARPIAMAASGAPSVTVAVCSRDRPAALRRALARLDALDPPPAERLLVDSASSGAGVAAVLDGAAAGGWRVLRAPLPGLSRARNLALAATRSAWLAFTDDDAEVPATWLAGLRRALAADPGLAAVTGPVVPAGIRGTAAELFEEYGGLCRGFTARTFDAGFVRQGWRSPPTWLLGAGASMAVDAGAVRAAGGFDEQLGAGVAAGCSEDSDLFYRLLRGGRRLAYEPAFWVEHHHRGDVAALRAQLAAYGAGHAAAQWKAWRVHRDPRALGRLLAGLHWTLLRRLLRRAIGRTRFPLSLMLAESLGHVRGPFLWRRSRARAAAAPRATPAEGVR